MDEAAFGQLKLNPAKLAFMRAVVPGALDAEKTFGIPAAVTLAQAVFEGAGGVWLVVLE